MSRITAEGLLLFVTALWGGTFAIIKATVDEVPPSTFTFIRFTVATIMAVAIWPTALKNWDRMMTKRGIVLGFLYGLGFVLQAIGLLYTTATSSALITGSAVAFVPIVFRFLDRSKIQRWHVVSVCVLLIGLYVFTLPDFSNLNLGDVLTFGSAIAWAAYIAFLDVYTRDLNDDKAKLNGLVIFQFLCTAVMAGVSALIIDRNDPLPTLTTEFGLAIAYCAIVASVVTTSIQTRVQRFTHPVRAGLIFTVEPLFGALIAWIALGEMMSPRQGLGAAIMFAAIIVPDLLMLWRNRK